MPYIGTRTTAKITPEKETAIKEKLGKAIELLPGKTEEWLMCEFCDSCRLWFRGDNSDESAYVEIKLLGKADPNACKNLTAAVCRILWEELAIPCDRTYVKFEECDIWGWNNIIF